MAASETTPSCRAQCHARKRLIVACYALTVAIAAPGRTAGRPLTVGGIEARQEAGSEGRMSAADYRMLAR